MKKIISLTLIVMLLSSLCIIPASALEFPDLLPEHWAYANVQTLVNDGTVSGYEDGTFKPSGTVTRAEFVKMLGKSNVLRPEKYIDVTSAHWGYDYIMYANFPEDGSNRFRPDVPITRGLVAELLWTRAGKPKAEFAPSIITSQYKIKDVAAWVYTNGLIRGDGDGITLRLDDTLTRAEAATLIVRSRNLSGETEEFKDIVNENIVKTFYESVNLFDNAPYEPEKVLTNGEMARAILRIASQESTLSYFKYNNIQADFTHDYARDVTIVFNKFLNKDNASAALADKAATFADTVSALSSAFIVKSVEAQNYGKTTSGLPADINNMMNVCLTFAKNKGIISLKENLSKPVTVKDFTVLCLLFDNVIGMESDTYTDLSPLGGLIQKNHSLKLTETKNENYRVIIKDIPSVVYNTPFTDIKNAPCVAYDFAREYRSVFISFVASFKSLIGQKTGTDVTITYYPSLVCETNTGYTLRVACKINSVPEGLKIGDIFAIKMGIKGIDKPVKEGMLLYIDIATGGPFNSVAATANTSYVDQIVAIYE